MEPIQPSRFYLIVGKPFKLPSGDYIVIMNIDTKQQYLSDIDSVIYSVVGNDDSISYKDTDGNKGSI